MYEYIIGTVEYVSPQYIVVENNGIGYQIFTPNPYLFTMDGEIQKIYTYLHVREDAQILYGFKNLETKEFFIKLINVSGIGPKEGHWLFWLPVNLIQLPMRLKRKIINI